MTALVLTAATLFTAIISGLFSMAGGMVLMGVFGFLLSVPAAMVLHGVAQTCSNGSRIWLYRRYIGWSVLLPYTAGATLVLLLFLSVSFVPSIGLVFMLIGLLPFVALRLPASLNLDMQRKPVAFSCGIVVTLAQMLAGASGPLLDMFYVTSSLGRREILGTKAVTQTLGHILKLGYYCLLLDAMSDELPMLVFPAVIAAAIVGNLIASVLAHRITDEQFRTVGRYLILAIATVYLGKGIYELAFV